MTVEVKAVIYNVVLLDVLYLRHEVIEKWLAVLPILNEQVGISMVAERPKEFGLENGGDETVEGSCGANSDEAVLFWFIRRKWHGSWWGVGRCWVR